MTGKYRVKFEPMGLAVLAPPGSTILAAAVQGIPIRADCGAEGVCGKCLVKAEPEENLSPLTELELDLLTAHQKAGSYRLACQARIRGPLTVTIPEQLADSQEAFGKTGLGGVYPVDALIERIILPEPPSSASDRESPGDRVHQVTQQVKELTGLEVCFTERNALRQLSLPEAFTGELTLVNHIRKGITAVIPGRRERSLGLAVDVGTTTVAAYLCNLQTGQVLASAASVNPQRRYGEDVISRIAMADRQDSGLKTLQELIVEAIENLIDRCLDQAGASREEIDEMTVVGNTTMEQILTAFHPHGLGRFPYLPVVRTFPDVTASDLGLRLNPGMPVYLFPVISAFVGGDTLGAILGDGAHRSDKTSLIVDIGTNGEVVLGNRKELWATSCATGPALEGAQISCGMRAVSGAIHKVDFDPLSCRINCQVLGEKGPVPAIGICGSGIIDAVAAMRRAGIILPSGRYNEKMPQVVCDEKGIGRKVVLFSSDQDAERPEVSVTLQDIRQIQLAKAALAVGIAFLMRRAGITRVDRTILTGAFGARFDWRNAVAIGMLPPEAMAGEVLTVDNLAGVGGIMALLDKKCRAEAARLSRRVAFLELAKEADFAKRFSEATVFPLLE